METLLNIAANVALGLMAFQLAEAVRERATHSILWPIPRARRGLTPLECMTVTRRPQA